MGADRYCVDTWCAKKRVSVFVRVYLEIGFVFLASGRCSIHPYKQPHGLEVERKSMKNNILRIHCCVSADKKSRPSKVYGEWNQCCGLNVRFNKDEEVQEGVCVSVFAVTSVSCHYLHDHFLGFFSL